MAGQAGVAQANNSYPEFGQGAKGYGRYYWHTLADAINENTWVEFIVPSIMHQDTRYYTLGKGNFGKRLGYAFTRIVITRSDSGHETFNYSEILGAGAFSGVANLYYPSQERTLPRPTSDGSPISPLMAAPSPSRKYGRISTTRSSTRKI